MGAKNGFTINLSKSQILAIVGGMISIISVFLPWFSATSKTSTLSVNGLFSVSGNGMLMGLIGSNSNWEFQGAGVLALGFACIVVAAILRDKIQGIAMVACGILIIGGGAVNLWSLRDISLFSGSIFGETVQSGIGYGLYAVVVGGVVTAAGGLLTWLDLTK
ncbi:Uncharacterised protein [uncultured archaeon]|nr:Uncharacterised protein [uncultured archaeon]